MSGTADWDAIHRAKWETAQMRQQSKREQEHRLASVTHAAHSIAYPATPSDALQQLAVVNSHRREAHLIPPNPTLGGILPSKSLEVDFVVPNTGNPLPNGFRLGQFSDISFPEWLDGCSGFGQSHPRNAQVMAVSWWSSHEVPWYHQFVAVDVTHATPSLTRGYTLIFERLGKLVGQEGIAKQQITIKDRVHETEFLKHDNLICALATTSIAIKAIVQQEIPHAGDANAPRGQPPTLGNVVTYMSMIVEQIPNYHVGKDNCYFFSRMLFHVMVLRHYTTFKFVWIPRHSATLAHDKPLARSPPSPRHSSSARPTLLTVASEPVDPLWTTIMRILKEREDKEGLLFYQRLRIFWRIIHITMILTLPASAFGGCLLGSSYFANFGGGEGAFVGIVVGIVLHGIVCVVILNWGPTALRDRKEELLRKTAGIIRCHVIVTPRTAVLSV